MKTIVIVKVKAAVMMRSSSNSMTGVMVVMVVGEIGTEAIATAAAKLQNVR